MSQRSLAGEIAVGVVIACIAAVVIARFGLDRSESRPEPAGRTQFASLGTTQDTTTQTFPLTGSWRGGFLLNGNPVTDVYTFYSNGTLVEALYNGQGQQMGGGAGRYTYSGGEVVITFSNGWGERATLTWVDPHQFRYQITEHTEQAQVGMEVLFKRIVR